MNYVKVNDFITIENEVYKCVPFIDGYDSRGCGMCDFDETTHCNQYDCSRGMREDLTESMFILYDDTSEDCND